MGFPCGKPTPLTPLEEGDQTPLAWCLFLFKTNTHTHTHAVVCLVHANVMIRGLGQSRHERKHTLILRSHIASPTFRQRPPPFSPRSVDLHLPLLEKPLKDEGTDLAGDRPSELAATDRCQRSHTPRAKMRSPKPEVLLQNLERIDIRPRFCGPPLILNGFEFQTTIF